MGVDSIIDKASKDMVADLASRWPWGTNVVVEQDGFRGSVVGWYRTREGKAGLNIEQAHTLIVHGYGETRVRCEEVF